MFSNFIESLIFVCRRRATSVFSQPFVRNVRLCFSSFHSIAKDQDTLTIFWNDSMWGVLSHGMAVLLVDGKVADFILELYPGKSWGLLILKDGAMVKARVQLRQVEREWKDRIAVAEK